MLFKIFRKKILEIFNNLNKVGVDGTFRGKVIFFNLKLNTRGKGGFLYFIDVEVRRRREQTELDILVVYADNDEY
jgi:hypothetical protein